MQNGWYLLYYKSLRNNCVISYKKKFGRWVDGCKDTAVTDEQTDTSLALPCPTGDNKMIPVVHMIMFGIFHSFLLF